MIVQTAQRRGNDWSRKYPPLMVIVAAIALAIYTLPSALNLPQANPGQVAEYAPVPGNNSSAPPEGNFAGLGLGDNSSAQGGAQQPGAEQQPGQPPPPPGALPPPPPGGVLQCFGVPPRQTEDPLSPPCVSSYRGDNGGNTWVGVTRHEIIVVIRMFEFPGECRSGSTQSNTCGTATGYYDMNNPSDVSQEFFFRYLHDWQTYFNTRYQTYGRFVHLWVYNDGNTAEAAAGSNAAGAQAIAANNWDHTYDDNIRHPFAALDQSFTFVDAYSQYLAQRGVMEFQQSATFTQQDYQGWPGFFWSYPPPTDAVAEAYATYVCTKIVAPGTVSFAGSGGATPGHGAKRVYGLLTTDDSQFQDAITLNNLAVADLQRDCGLGSRIPYAYKGTFHYAEGDYTGPSSGWSVTNIPNFIKNGVSTIIWPGGTEYEDQRTASQLHYFPEWVMAGDGQDDGNLIGLGEPTDESPHFVVVTPQTLQNADGHGVEQPCAYALQNVDPTLDRQSGDYGFACEFYAPLRQLFTGIQLSGPRLTAPNINQGFHAIPAKPSTGPTQPACFYLAKDYSCVKDDVAEFFDPTAQTVTSNPTEDETTSKGCWRMWRNGFRYLPGQWPAGDAYTDYRRTEICNLYAGGYIAGPRTDH